MLLVNIVEKSYVTHFISRSIGARRIRTPSSCPPVGTHAAQGEERTDESNHSSGEPVHSSDCGQFVIQQRKFSRMTTLTGPWMALYSSSFATGVTVRPIQHNDANLIDEMHERLSSESVYYRYLQYRRPSLTELVAVCRLDPAKGAGFVATRQDEGTVVGLAYYVREAQAEAPTAEPGILVEDRFQAQGIGRRLWQEVQHHARLAGIRWLRVWSHPGNQRLAQLVRGGGAPYTAQIHDGLSEYLVDLGEQPHLAAQALLGQHSELTRGGLWRSGDDRLSRN